MIENVWTRISNKRPKGKQLFKVLGILSGTIWVVSFGAIFLFRDKALPHALTHAAGVENDTLDISGHKIEKKSTANSSDESHAVLTVDMPTKSEAQALRELAEMHVVNGDFEKAVDPIRRVLTIPTRDAILLTLATKVFLATGNYSEALKMGKQARLLLPADIPLNTMVIDATYRLGQVEKAFAAGREAVKKAPTNLQLLIQLGTMEVELGQAQPDYGKSLEAALKIKPDYLPALYLLGRKEQLEGNYKGADLAFKRLLKLDPECAKAHGQRGMALYHLGQLKEAQHEYESGLASNPKDYNTWFNLGELHLLIADQQTSINSIQSHHASAMDCYLKALYLNSKHAQAHYRVGVLLNGNGQYKEAIRHLESAFKLDSRHVPTLVQLGLAFENLKQPERAKEFLTKAYELDPFNKVVLFKLKHLT